ncbi:hypothetical protein DFH27DRAFT_1513 [Peziza echinospora]|nr:hypothetical protein DFH27DRAFT_1513 [Peziza echinospora]
MCSVGCCLPFGVVLWLVVMGVEGVEGKKLERAQECCCCRSQWCLLWCQTDRASGRHRSTLPPAAGGKGWGGCAASKLGMRRDGFRELATGKCWRVDLSMPEGRRREARLDV